MAERVQKYDRRIVGKCGTSVIVDVYRVLAAFEVADNNIGHAIKKLLCAGMRNGGKPTAQDIDEAIWTLQELQTREEQKAKYVCKTCQNTGRVRDLHPDAQASSTKPCPDCQR